ncbi:MAG: DUF6786 family protein [Pirellulales bacterium]
MTVSAVRAEANRFQGDVEFLRKHVEMIVLGAEAGGPRVAVVPAYQGRVMTSTTGGATQPSFGWINYEHIASGKSTPHINVFGGEERFWLGPEGGQFSIFFPPGGKFELADWQTPAAIDTEPFAVVERSNTSASFRHETTLKNYSNAEFAVRIDRKIDLLSKADAEKSLGVELGGVKLVGYRTTNRLTNTGTNDWQKQNGLLSIWILGMYKPGPRTTVVVPFRQGEDATLGPVVNDAYFGKPPAERLKLGDGVLFFSGDGNYRSKIGLSPRRARDLAGSWDAEAGVLTIVKYTQPDASVTDYVNSMWEIQSQPYAGDVVNAYNDGPPAPGAKPLGPFYELETSSPALALAAGQSAEHVQETYHFEGDRAKIDALSKKLLGASLDEIENSLKK